MSTRLSWVILTTLLCTALSFAKPAPLKPPSMVTTQMKSLSPFSHLDIKGRIDVQLHTGYKKPQMILKGDVRDLMQVQMRYKQDTLLVLLQPAYPMYGPVSAEIRASSLAGFGYQGSGLVSGNRLYSKGMDLSINNSGLTKLGGRLLLRELHIDGAGQTQISGAYSRHMELHMKGKPNVQISGELNLASLDVDGGGVLNCRGISSYNLKIRASKKANIQLDGAVNWLDLELWGKARFNGLHLYAKRTFVKTHDRAFAQIHSLNHQSSLAMDASDIFYYTLPVTRADFMACNGAVLDMRDWDEPDYSDYSVYNHQFP